MHFATIRHGRRQALGLLRALPLLSLIVMLGLPPPAQAQWKWRDQTGQINVSDRPPPRDIPDKDILARPAPVAPPRRPAPAGEPAESGTSDPPSAAAAAASAPPTALEREVQARRRALEQEQAAKAKADAERLAKVRAENCQGARGQLAALESGQRMARVNAAGEREVLDDAARAAELRRAREVIASDCR